MIDFSRTGIRTVNFRLLKIVCKQSAFQIKSRLLLEHKTQTETNRAFSESFGGNAEIAGGKRAARVFEMRCIKDVKGRHQELQLEPFGKRKRSRQSRIVIVVIRP